MQAGDEAIVTLVLRDECMVRGHSHRRNRRVRYRQTMAEPVSAQQVNRGVGDMLVRWRHSKPSQETVGSAELGIVAAADDQLHLGTGSRLRT